MRSSVLEEQPPQEQPPQEQLREEQLVEACNLMVRRGAFELSVESWSLRPGEVVGLVGANGAGKTTLLQALAGLIPVQGGSVSVFGLDPYREASRVRTALAYMSDDQALFELRIEELLRLVSGYYRSWDAALVKKLLELFELDRAEKVTALSKGQGTRLRLLLALAFRPRVLLLDEPATGLDLAGRRALLRSVLEVTEDPQRSVVVSSHMLGDVERLADRLMVLDRGRVVRDDATESLLGEEQTLEEAMVAWGLG